MAKGQELIQLDLCQWLNLNFGKPLEYQIIGLWGNPATDAICSEREGLKFREDPFLRHRFCTPLLPRFVGFWRLTPGFSRR